MNQLLISEVKGITYQNDIKLAVYHDNFFIYCDMFNTVRTFDPNGPTNEVLPPPDKKVTGNVIAIDFSPSKKYAAVAYDDISLQLFDLQNNKPFKLIHKGQRGKDSNVQSILFYSDSLLLYIFHDGTFCLYKINPVAFLSKETKILTTTSKPTGLFRPPSHSSDDTKNKETLIAISTVNSFVLMTLNLSTLETKQIIGLQAGNLIPAFYSLSSTLLMVLLYPNKVDVYLLDSNGNQKSDVITIPVDFQLTYLTFLSPSYIIGHDFGYKHFVLITIETERQPMTGHSSLIECPVKGCLAKSQSSNSLLFFSGSLLWKVVLPSFEVQMESFSESVDNSEKAIEFCRRAIQGGSLETIGLPVNQCQRLLVIENSISKILSNYLFDSLNKNIEDADNIAEKFVQICKDLNLQEWLISDAVPLFESKNVINLLLKKIVKADPGANVFLYDHHLVQLLLQNYDEQSSDVEVTNFILSLSSRVCSPAEVLQFAHRTKDNYNLAEIYADRFGDVVSGLQILANADMYEKACLMLLHSDELDIQIKWAFTYTNNRFHHIEKLLMCGKQSKPVFDTFQFHIESTRAPISLNDYVNAMLLSISNLFNENRENEFVIQYLTKLENLILDQKIRLIKSSMQFLIHIIFPEKVPPNDSPDKPRLEKLLDYILMYDLPEQFKEMVIRLCDKYEYKNIKKKFQEDSQKVDSEIQDSLFDPSSDTFSLIRNMINNEKMKSIPIEQSLIPFIRSAVISQATIFLVKNVKQFAQLIADEFPNAALTIINQIQQEKFQNVFIHEFTKVYNSYLKLSQEKFLQYANFLAKNYPNETCEYIEISSTEGMPVTDLMDLCSQYKIWDAYAFLLDLTNDFGEATNYIAKYQQEELVMFAQGHVSSEYAEHVISTIFGFVEKRIKKKSISDETQRMATMLIKGMVMPLYALQKIYNEEKKTIQEANEDTILHGANISIDGYKERVDVLTDYLKNICILLANAMPFSDLLEILVVEYQQLDFGFAKSALLSVINDYAYDIDTTSAMCQLYRQDEANDYSNLILTSTRGIANNNMICCTCHQRILGVDDKIRIYPCGHVFHINVNCLPRQMCPICNTVEKINQSIPPPHISVLSRATFSKLRRFEYILKRHSSTFEQKDLSVDSKAQIVIDPSTLAFK